MTFDGVEGFDVVDRDGTSSFTAYGFRSATTTPGRTVTFESGPGAPDTTPEVLIHDLRVRGVAVHGEYRAVVGDMPITGNAPGPARLRMAKRQLNGTWLSVTPTLPGPNPTLPFIEVLPIGVDGFLAIGENAVWRTAGPADGWREYDPLNWVDITADVAALFGGTLPVWSSAARVGPGAVLVGAGGAVAVWRPRPPGILAAIDWTDWEWTRMDVVSGANPPNFTAVAVDEVQEIGRRFVPPGINNSWTNKRFRDIIGQVLAASDAGAVYRFDVRMTRLVPDDSDESGVGDTDVDTDADTDPNSQPEVPAASYAPAHVESFTLPTACPENPAQPVFARTIFSDERSRVFAGTCGKIFTLPKTSPFTADHLLDRTPSAAVGIPRNTVVWRGSYSDTNQLLVVGSGFRTNAGTTTAMLVWGYPQTKDCNVLGTTAPGANAPEMTFSIANCQPVPTGPPLNWSMLETPLAKVLLNRDGEPDVDDRVVPIVGPEATITLDTDPDSQYEVWNVSTEVAAGNPGAGQQLDIRVFPNVFATAAQQNAYTLLVQDLVAERTQVTFKTGAQPRPFVNGHIRDVFARDLLTGLSWQNGVWVEPAATVPVDAEPFPEAVSPNADPPTCLPERQDQVSALGFSSTAGANAFDVRDRIGWISRLRSLDGHAYVDDYEALGEGGDWRFQSMKHYIKGRCFFHEPADTEWFEDCCINETTVKQESFDVYAPFGGYVVVIPNTSWVSARAQGQLPLPGDPASTIPALVGNPAQELYSYLYGVRGTEFPDDCSWFNDPSVDVEDLPTDGQILALVHPSMNLVMLMDHGQWCFTEDMNAAELAAQPQVVAGTRLGTISTHGFTEVSVWVNDVADRWRLVSYFDELSPELYNLYHNPNGPEYFDQMGFASRDVPSIGHPVISLAERDACPVEPEFGPEIGRNMHPDIPPQRYQCKVVNENINVWRPTCTSCPPEVLNRADLPEQDIPQPELAP